MRRFVFVLTVGLVLVCAPALAGTPDGESPAEESVCDDLKWATPGLYGLCVAFCEAQDCEPDYSLDNPVENCKPASRKILENYRKKMRPGDPDMPCMQEPCPCWTVEELDALWAPVLGNQIGCRRDYTDGALERFNEDTFFLLTSLPERWPGYGLTTIENWRRYGEDRGPYCQFDLVYGSVDIHRQYFISLEEFLVCEEQLDQAGAQVGFSCFLP